MNNNTSNTQFVVVENLLNKKELIKDGERFIKILRKTYMRNYLEGVKKK